MALGVKPGHFIHPKNNLSWGFDMIFFGIAWAFFVALLVIAAWAFYGIHKSQFSS
jgi:hypothetical protein